MATLDIIVKPKLKFSLKKCGEVVPYGITPEERAKLAGIEENANDYTHPETHPASILDVVDVVNGAANKFLNERGEMVAVAHESLTDKNSEAAFQHVDTTTTKPTLDAADMVSIKDSVTGKMVLTPKSNFVGEKVTLIEVQTPAFSIQPTIDLANNKFLLSGLNTGNSGVLSENSAVDFLTDGILPNGFSSWESNYYFVHIVDSNSFQLMTARNTVSSVININNVGSNWKMRYACVDLVTTDPFSMKNTDILMQIIYIWDYNTAANGDLGIAINLNNNVKYFGSQGYINNARTNLELIRSSVGGKKYGFGHHSLSFMTNSNMIKVNRDAMYIVSDNKDYTGATVNADFLERHTSFVTSVDTHIVGIFRGVNGRTALKLGNGSKFKIIEK